MALADTVAGTALAARVAEAAEKAVAGAASEDHFVSHRRRPHRTELLART